MATRARVAVCSALALLLAFGPRAAPAGFAPDDDGQADVPRANVPQADDEPAGVPQSDAATAGDEPAVGAPPGDAPAGPVAELETVTDSAGRVSIGLPPVRKALASPEGALQNLQVWTIDLDGDGMMGDLVVYVDAHPAWARAVLMGSRRRSLPYGQPIPGTERTAGPERPDAGEWLAESKDERHHFLVRAIEREGEVFVVAAQMRLENWDRFRADAERIVASYRANEGWRHTPLPESFARLDHPTLDVWSSVPRKDVERLLREADATLATAAKVLGPGPYTAAPVRLVLCRRNEDYRALWDARRGAPPDRPCFADEVGRRLVVDLTKQVHPDFASEVMHGLADLSVSRHFGGTVQPWVHTGLLVSVKVGFWQNGKFDVPVPKHHEQIRAAAVEAARTLSAHRAIAWLEDDGTYGNYQMEVYAWHVFFRSGAGQKPYGGRYRKMLETLRKTGDTVAAEKVWDGVDQKKMHREFLDWVARWKVPAVK